MANRNNGKEAKRSTRYELRDEVLKEFIRFLLRDSEERSYVLGFLLAIWQWITEQASSVIAAAGELAWLVQVDGSVDLPAVSTVIVAIAAFVVRRYRR